MNAGDGDKRKITTDALETLGTIITENEKRDAIHLAVENVVAKERLLPGQHVTADGRLTGLDRDDLVGVGIVDPFLSAPVMPGQRFWLVIYPRQIHSLRHVWTHPAFPEPFPFEIIEPVKENNTLTSEQWLRSFCASSDCPSYETVIAAVKEDGFGRLIKAVQVQEDYNYGTYTLDDEYFHFNGIDAHSEIPPEFWDHIERVIGQRVGPERRAKSFSCSC
jgi:hypothetical protein